MNRIFVTGDTHGMHSIDKLIPPNNFQIQENLTKDDYLIVLGDFGCIWTSESHDNLSPRDKNIIEWYERKNYTTLFVDGNHENHKVISEFPVSEWNSGKIHKISDSIYHLMRGQVFNIGGITLFTMGGAYSVDKGTRTENVSWWKEELPSEEEYAEAMKNLSHHNMEVDYVLTHDCATTYSVGLTIQHNYPNKLNEFLRKIEFDDRLKFKKWYFGHHHKDANVSPKHTCLYNNIIELY